MKTLQLILVVLSVVPFDAVTVNSLCPTNKIAPYKRFAQWDSDTASPRTFGAFYDLLLSSDSQQSRPPNSLQEEPQKDEPDDCGEIEDYDETDISAFTPRPERRRAYVDSRLYFSGLFNRPQYGQPPPHNGEYPQYSPGSQQGQRPQYSPGPQQGQKPQYGQGQRPHYGQRPQQAQRPQHGKPQQLKPVTSRPTRPPRPNYSATATRPPSGGYFGNNLYRPPFYQNPSENLKPVHEEGHELQSTYHPDLVGGPIGHVIGVTALKPTRRPPTEDELAIHRKPSYQYPTRPTQNLVHTTRPLRPRQLNNNSVLGSFIDLLI